MHSTLADSSSGSAILWSLIVIALVMVGLVVALQLRKWLFAADEPSGKAGFNLSDLRRMHKEGRMTDVEFEKAKALIVGAAKASPPAKPPVPPQRRGPDPSSQL